MQRTLSGENMKRTYEMIITIMILILIPSFIQAKTQKEALREAAEYFVKKAVNVPQGKSLYITDIVNSNSELPGEIGKQIENDLYFELDALSPDFRLFLGDGSESGDNIFLSGSYTKRSNQLTLNLRIFRSLKRPEILSQFSTKYQLDESRSRQLVAILDLEAQSLNNNSRKAFSEIFRAAMSRIDPFELVSNADIDKLDPKAVQQASGCTRDECATIIGEQLGVDRVISTSLLKINDQFFVLSGKIIHIEDGTIIISRTVKHKAKLSTLDQSIEILAKKLTSSNYIEEDKPEDRFIKRKRLKYDSDDRPTDDSKSTQDHRRTKHLFLGFTPIGLHLPTVLTQPLNAGLYIGSGMQLGIEYANVPFEKGSATATATNNSIYVRLFPGNSFNVRFALNERKWSAETDLLGFKTRTTETRRYFVFGIGNHWITDSGISLGADWAFLTLQLGQSNTSTTDTSQTGTQQSKIISELDALKDDVDLFSYNFGFVNFCIGFSF